MSDIILCNATLYRFDFEEPEVLFSESTPLVYQVYFGLDPLGPTDEQLETTTILEVSSISHFSYKIHLIFHIQLGSNILQTFTVPSGNNTVVAYLQVFIICFLQIIVLLHFCVRFVRISLGTFKASGVSLRKWRLHVSYHVNLTLLTVSHYMEYYYSNVTLVPTFLCSIGFHWFLKIPWVPLVLYTSSCGSLWFH